MAFLSRRLRLRPARCYSRIRRRSEHAAPRFVRPSTDPKFAVGIRCGLVERNEFTAVDNPAQTCAGYLLRGLAIVLAATPLTSRIAIATLEEGHPTPYPCPDPCWAPPSPVPMVRTKHLPGPKHLPREGRVRGRQTCGRGRHSQAQCRTRHGYRRTVGTRPCEVVVENSWLLQTGTPSASKSPSAKPPPRERTRSPRKVTG